MPNFYLNDLAITQQLTEAATMSGSSATIDADATIIEESISLSDAKDVFKCIFSSGSLTTNPAGKFTADDTFLSVFEDPSTDDVLPFVSGLVQEMTGASGASDVLDNESDVKADVVAKIISGITAIESGEIDNDATKGNAACVSLFNQIKEADAARFKLISSVPATTGGNDIESVTYTNCLVTSQGNGAGATVTEFDYDTLTLTLTGNDSGANPYANGEVLLFIHPVTGTGFKVAINGTQAGTLNGNGTTTLTMTEIAEANITAGTFSLYKKLGSGDTITVTPNGTTVLTTEHDGTNITDTTNTTANNAGQSDFADGDVIVAYKTGASPEAIVLTLNTITAAYLNNDLANTDGVSMPLLATDKLDFKVTIEAAGTQKDASGVDITYTHNFGLRGTLDA